MSTKIVIGDSKKLKGIRCVNAACAIKKGELIESCPIILIPVSEGKIIDGTVLGNYKFVWNKEFECLVLGYGCLYNHSFTPNAVYKMDYIHKKMNFYALTNIAIGDEIQTNYNGDPEDSTDIEASYLDYKL
jgi:SET domain-containing protein